MPRSYPIVEHSGRWKLTQAGIPVSEHLFGNSGVGWNSGVAASFRVADDHDGAAHGREIRGEKSGVS